MSIEEPSNTHPTGNQTQDHVVDQFLLTTLTQPRERMHLLKIEQELLTFLRDPSRSHIDYPPIGSYQRLQIHKVAEYYNLDHVVLEHGEGTKRALVISKSQKSRIPSRLLWQLEVKVNPSSTTPSPTITNSNNSSASNTPTITTRPITVSTPPRLMQQHQQQQNQQQPQPQSQQHQSPMIHQTQQPQHFVQQQAPPQQQQHQSSQPLLISPDLSAEGQQQTQQQPQQIKKIMRRQNMQQQHHGSPPQHYRAVPGSPSTARHVVEHQSHHSNQQQHQQHHQQQQSHHQQQQQTHSNPNSTQPSPTSSSQSSNELLPLPLPSPQQIHTPQTGSEQNSDKANGAEDPERSIEQREQDYIKARARIFGNNELANLTLNDSQQTGALVDSSSSASGAGTLPSRTSSTVQLLQPTQLQKTHTASSTESLQLSDPSNKSPSESPQTLPNNQQQQQHPHQYTNRPHRNQKAVTKHDEQPSDEFKRDLVRHTRRTTPLFPPPPNNYLFIPPQEYELSQVVPTYEGAYFVSPYPQNQWAPEMQMNGNWYGYPANAAPPPQHPQAIPINEIQQAQYQAQMAQQQQFQQHQTTDSNSSDQSSNQANEQYEQTQQPQQQQQPHLQQRGWTGQAQQVSPQQPIIAHQFQGGYFPIGGAIPMRISPQPQPMIDYSQQQIHQQQPQPQQQPQMHMQPQPIAYGVGIPVRRTRSGSGDLPGGRNTGGGGGGYTTTYGSPQMRYLNTSGGRSNNGQRFNQQGGFVQQQQQQPHSPQVIHHYPNQQFNQHQQQQQHHYNNQHQNQQHQQQQQQHQQQHQQAQQQEREPHPDSVLEIVDSSGRSSSRTNPSSDFQSFLRKVLQTGAELKWVDDKNVYAVYNSPTTARNALETTMQSQAPNSPFSLRAKNSSSSSTTSTNNAATTTVTSSGSSTTTTTAT